MRTPCKKTAEIYAVRKKAEKAAANPTLLELLKAGARVEFSDGFVLRGQPATKYIDIGRDLGEGFASEGLWNLTEEGLRDAMDDIKKMRQSDANETDRKAGGPGR